MSVKLNTSQYNLVVAVIYEMTNYLDAKFYSVSAVYRHRDDILRDVIADYFINEKSLESSLFKRLEAMLPPENRWPFKESRLSIINQLQFTIDKFFDVEDKKD